MEALAELETSKSEVAGLVRRRLEHAETLAEASAALGIPESMARHWWQDAVKFLRRRLRRGKDRE